jgi:hypothetical protein
MSCDQIICGITHEIDTRDPHCFSDRFDSVAALWAGSVSYAVYYGNADTNAVPDTVAGDDAEWKHL